MPTVMEFLDSITYPVAETIIYEMIHNRHKHQREDHLIKQRSLTFRDAQNRRKHMNSRRNDVSILFGSLCYFCFIFIIYYNYRNGGIVPKQLSIWSLSKICWSQCSRKANCDLLKNLRHTILRMYRKPTKKMTPAKEKL